MDREMVNINANLVKEAGFSEFEKGDLIHVFRYFKENKKGDKVYKNFIVKSLNKIEKRQEN
ncbi:MAG: hypothetical protein KHZ80_03220 [Anaerococcus vaginalis]|uniref:hypothetical protein n=1 Tax=Anaerococcus vaginalis TaxID=33037 RepID=UPI001D27C311|nr:hypothetical protein [Anaerococcus vaginalis]MBS4889031.1 hypothetical protein [Anaerococcus vaginalis]